MSYIPIEIRRTAGRPQYSESDFALRRRLYVRWKRRLALSNRELAELTGLSITTIASYHANSRRDAVATDRTIEIMRDEAVRRIYAAQRELDDHKLKLEILKQQWEDECKEAAIFDPDAEEAA